jgi:F-type H+-transporting ATPase subunit b
MSSEIFEKLGLNGALLISQIVNFVLLIILLKRFAYEPILKTLDDRAKKIEKSLEQAKKIEEELRDTEATKVAEIRKAKEQAQEIVKSAYETAEANAQKVLDETKRKTQEIVKKAKEEIQDEKEKSVKEAEREIGDLAIQIAEKIIKRNLDSDTQKKLAEETLSKIR